MYLNFAKSLIFPYDLQSMTKVLGTPESDSTKMRWQLILETISNGIAGEGTPLPPDPPAPDNIGNEQWRIRHDKQHWIGGRGMNW